MALISHAQGWVRTIIDGLNRPFPWGAAHHSSGPDDVDVTPWLLHPAFHGCLDWHSSAHMQWSGVTLLACAAQRIESATRDELVDVLNDRLTVANAQVEKDYLRTHRGFERPYGWGWAALLAAQCEVARPAETRHVVAATGAPSTSDGSSQRSCASATTFTTALARAAEPQQTSESPEVSTLPEAAGWAEATGIVAKQVFENLLAWLPTLTVPVRTGTHDNTAFGIGLCLDAARVLGRTDVVAAIVEHSHRFFDADHTYPVEWEPSGHDFLSAGLSEAHLMARVFQVEGRGEEFGGWLSAFLPRLGQAGDTLLTVPDVLDGTDGRLAHLYGLSLSRAWQLRALTPWLDEDVQRRIAQVTARQVSAVEPQISDGDFMATHWLVSFAVQAELASSKY